MGTYQFDKWLDSADAGQCFPDAPCCCRNDALPCPACLASFDADMAAMDAAREAGEYPDDPDRCDICNEPGTEDNPIAHREADPERLSTETYYHAWGCPTQEAQRRLDVFAALMSQLPF